MPWMPPPDSSTAARVPAYQTPTVQDITLRGACSAGSAGLPGQIESGGWQRRNPSGRSVERIQAGLETERRSGRHCTGTGQELMRPRLEHRVCLPSLGKGHPQDDNELEGIVESWHTSV